MPTSRPLKISVPPNLHRQNPPTCAWITKTPKQVCDFPKPVAVICINQIHEVLCCVKLKGTVFGLVLKPHVLRCMSNTVANNFSHLVRALVSPHHAWVGYVCGNLGVQCFEMTLMLAHVSSKKNGPVETFNIPFERTE